MMLQYTTYSTAVATAAVAAFCAASNAQPMFTGMGIPPPGPFCTGFIIHGVTDAGTVYGGGCGVPMLWDRVQGYVILPGIAPSDVGEIDSFAEAQGLYFGRAEINEWIIPVVWHSITLPPFPLAGFPADWTCDGASCNATGSIVVGNMRHQTTNQSGIFIWRDGPAASKKKMQVMTEFPPGISIASVSDIDDAGKHAFGGSTNSGISSFQAIRWQPTTGIELLGDLAGGPVNSSLPSCNWNGSIAAGGATPSSGKKTAALWTERTNWYEVGLYDPNDSGSGVINDGDGWQCFGTSGLSIGQFKAISWNPVDGMRLLQEILVSDYGLTEAALWDLRFVDAISPNGRYIAGRGINPQGANETWFAQITPFCYADCTGDKVLNIFDYICFGSEFANQTLYANCDNDGSMNIFDYICYGNHFAEGCP